MRELLSLCDCLWRGGMAETPRKLKLWTDENVVDVRRDQPLVPDLDPECIEEDQRIARLERPVLPFGDRFQNSIDDRRDQVGGDIDSVEFRPSGPGSPARSCRARTSTRSCRRSRKPPLIALDQLRIERSLPIARNAHVDLRVLGQDLLLRVAVAMVRTALRRFALQMIVQFGV